MILKSVFPIVKLCTSELPLVHMLIMGLIHGLIYSTNASFSKFILALQCHFSSIIVRFDE